MSLKVPKLRVALVATGIAAALLAYFPAGQAFDFGNMMNPSKWMGGGDRYDDYEDGPYGGPWGGPYGGGPWGGPYTGGPYGGGPWGGPYGVGPYGGSPYGAYGVPGYTATQPAAPATPVAPAAKTQPQPAASSGELDELKRRIEELESQQRPVSSPPPSDWGSAPASSDWGSAPAFRPMEKN